MKLSTMKLTIFDVAPPTAPDHEYIIVFTDNPEATENALKKMYNNVELHQIYDTKQKMHTIGRGVLERPET